MFSQRRSHYWSQQSRTFFFKGFSAKQQKKPKKAANYSVIEQNALSDKHPKMTGQNDRPDESLTGQTHDQARHCLLTGRYFEPCFYKKDPSLRVYYFGPVTLVPTSRRFYLMIIFCTGLDSKVYCPSISCDKFFPVLYEGVSFYGNCDISMCQWGYEVLLHELN